MRPASTETARTSVTSTDPGKARIVNKTCPKSFLAALDARKSQVFVYNHPRHCTRSPGRKHEVSNQIHGLEVSVDWFYSYRQAG